MAALSAVVFSLSWWLGLYLLARDPRKPVLVLAADRPDQLRDGGGAGRGPRRQRFRSTQQHRDLSRRRAGHRLVRGAARTVPPARHLAQPRRRDRGWSPVVAAVALVRRRDGGQRRRPAAAGPLGDVRGDLAVLARRDGPRGAAACATADRWSASSSIATLFFALGNAILIIPLGPGAELAGVGVHRIRRRAARRRRGDVGRVRRGPGAARRHAALVRGDGAWWRCCSAGRR